MAGDDEHKHSNNPLQAFAGALGNAVGGAVSAVADTIGHTVGGGVQAAGKAVQALENIVPGAGAGVTAEQYIKQVEEEADEGANDAPSSGEGDHLKASEQETLDALHETDDLPQDKTGITLSHGQDLSAPTSDGQTAAAKVTAGPVEDVGGLKDIEMVRGIAVPKDYAARLLHPEQKAAAPAASQEVKATDSGKQSEVNTAAEAPEPRATSVDVVTSEEPQPTPVDHVTSDPMPFDDTKPSPVDNRARSTAAAATEAPGKSTASEKSVAPEKSAAPEKSVAQETNAAPEKSATPEDVHRDETSATFVEGVPHVSSKDVQPDSSKDNVHAEGNITTGIKEEVQDIGEKAVSGVKSAVEAVAGTIGNTVGAGVSAVSSAVEKVGLTDGQVDGQEQPSTAIQSDATGNQASADKAAAKPAADAAVGDESVPASGKGKGEGGVEKLSPVDQIIASSEPLKDKNDVKRERDLKAQIAKKQAEFEAVDNPAEDLKEAPKTGPVAELDNPSEDINTPAKERPDEDFNPEDVPATQKEAIEAQAAVEGKTVIVTAEILPPAVLTGDGELPMVPDTDKELLQQLLDKSAEKAKDFHDPIADLPLHPEPAPSLHLPGEKVDAENPTALPQELDRNATEAAKHAPRFAGDTGDSHKPSFAELAKKNRPLDAAEQ